GRRLKQIEEVDSIGENPQNICIYSRISQMKVKKGLRKIGGNKVVRLDEIPIKAWRCLRDEWVRWLTLLFNKTFLRAKMPEERRLYMDIKLLGQTMKL
ncbi:hypothetical protein Tco_0708084, partial [Tanacetum coccineum]